MYIYPIYVEYSRYTSYTETPPQIKQAELLLLDILHWLVQRLAILLLSACLSRSRDSSTEGSLHVCHVPAQRFHDLCPYAQAQRPHGRSCNTRRNGLDLVVLIEPTVYALALRQHTQNRVGALGWCSHEQQDEEEGHNENAWEKSVAS